MRLRLVFLLIMALGCGTGQERLERVSAVEAHDLIRALDLEKSALIDGRTPEMYADGHIDGAVQIDAFAPEAGETLEPFLARERIILYCTSHRRSDALTGMLQEQQFSGEIVVIADGITGWKAAGYEVVGGTEVERVP